MTTSAKRFEWSRGFCSVLDDRIVFTKIGRFSGSPVRPDVRKSARVRAQYASFVLAILALVALWKNPLLWVKIVSGFVAVLFTLFGLFGLQEILPSQILLNDLKEIRFVPASFFRKAGFRVSYLDPLGASAVAYVRVRKENIAQATDIFREAGLLRA